MSRILTGIQSTNIPHLGNILGAIIPAIELSKSKDNTAFCFIADLHALTSNKDSENNRLNANAVAATWIAFGFDVEKNIFYRQSDVPEVCELAWYLNCFTPYPMLANAHSFKDKSEYLADVNAGLFTYPVLMAADILLYQANIVPVGKDQVQHLEMVRDIAKKFNNQYEPVFTIPEAKFESSTMLIPGTDGRKMSKSYNNFINIFLPENDLMKVINGIQTNNASMDEPKSTLDCNIFALYKLLASAEQIQEMENNYASAVYGYGQAKFALYELILNKFSQQRNIYNYYMNHRSDLDKILKEGALKAREFAEDTLYSVRESLGFKQIKR